MRRIYLDANGSSPAIYAAKNKITTLLDRFGNPSSFHSEGRHLRALIDEARHYVATAIQAQDKEVIFTSGASEANRLVVDALIKRARTQALKVLMSPFEHPSLLKPVIEASLAGYFLLNLIELDKSGQLKPDIAELQACDVLIVCQAHNETGIIPDLGTLLPYVKAEALVVSDIAQAFARLNPPDERVDIITFSAQKMGGYPGAGGLVLRGQGKKLSAPWLGGGQERGFRPGTESSLLIAAMGEAARLIEEQRAEHQELTILRNQFEGNLLSQTAAKIIGHSLPRLPNTSAICFMGQDADALRIGCDIAGLSVGFGAACSGLAPEGSFALKKLGLSLNEEKATIRFSLTTTTSKSDMDEAGERLLNLVLTHKSHA